MFLVRRCFAAKDVRNQFSSSPRRILHCLSEERTFEIRLPEGRVFVRYQGRSDDLKFSVMLQTQTVEGWQTVCLIDNAEGKGTHIHRYAGTRKLPAQPFHPGAAREGVPAARDFLRAYAHDILEAWQSNR